MPKHRRKTQPIDVSEWAADASLKGIESLLASRLSSSPPSTTEPGIPARTPTGDLPTGAEPSSELPTGQPPMVQEPMGSASLSKESPEESRGLLCAIPGPMGETRTSSRPMGQSPSGFEPIGISPVEHDDGDSEQSVRPMVDSPMGGQHVPSEGQMVVVPGQGLRRLYRCTNGHHGHSAAEDALWMFMLWVARGGRNADPA